MPPGQPGAAGDAPESTDRVSDYLSVSHRLRNFRSHYLRLGKHRIVYEIEQAVKRAKSRVLTQFRKHGGDENQLAQRPAVTTRGEQAYRLLREVADRAEEEGNRDRFREIGRALCAVDDYAVSEFRRLVAQHRITAVPSTQPVRRVGLAAPTTAVPATPPPARAIRDFDWIGAYRQLRWVDHQLKVADPKGARGRIHSSLENFATHVRRRFARFDERNEYLPPRSDGARTRPEQQYLAIEAMWGRAAESGDTAGAAGIREQLDALNGLAATVMHELVCEFGPLDELVVQAETPVPQPRVADAATPVPVGTIPNNTVSDASLLPLPWPGDDFAVERALIAGKLPPGFDASALIAKASTHKVLGIGEELAAGRLPSAAIDGLLVELELTDQRGSNALVIEHLRSLDENIERALLAAYPGRVDPEWLRWVRGRCCQPGENPVTGATPAGGLAARDLPDNDLP